MGRVVCICIWTTNSSSWKSLPRLSDITSTPCWGSQEPTTPVHLTAHSLVTKWGARVPWNQPCYSKVWFGRAPLIFSRGTERNFFYFEREKEQNRTQGNCTLLALAPYKCSKMRADSRSSGWLSSVAPWRPRLVSWKLRCRYVWVEQGFGNFLYLYENIFFLSTMSAMSYPRG
jgi:hypothetical protein